MTQLEGQCHQAWAAVSYSRWRMAEGSQHQVSLPVQLSRVSQQRNGLYRSCQILPTVEIAPNYDSLVGTKICL
ncbi:hypothetical protein RRG08_050480 [Elysia crispata]|uniref:Uncharacterized protein n=1 Tax=Elysia crispata TaxID=231223 RepID=A0AAE0YBU6_9GAST|nr:hypothetical protein RRG08_050480 [Elysia crispata]